MAPLVAMTCAEFSGYALLLTVAPLWAVEGGATTVGSGLVNGVLLLFTVLTQLFVPRAAALGVGAGAPPLSHADTTTWPAQSGTSDPSPVWRWPSGSSPR